MIGIAALQRKIRAYLGAEQCERVETAHAYSKNAHLGQFRASGKPYIQHPLTVADILADWRFDDQSIVAALLHDVVEDTAVSLTQVRETFGNSVARLVDGLSKMERLEGMDRRRQEAETFRKILLTAADDWRVLFIKLADRLHNMRTLSALPDGGRRRRIALETLLIYAPIAERLGFSPVRDELQNLSFRHLRPHRHRVLSKALRNSKSNSRHVIARIEEAIREALVKHDIRGRLEKRRKNLHSIYQKMGKAALVFRASGGHYRLSPDCGEARRLLRRLGRAARALCSRAREVQGLHRPAEVQRLSVAAHDIDDKGAGEGRDSNSHRGNASGGGARAGGALDV